MVSKSRSQLQITSDRVGFTKRQTYYSETNRRQHLVPSSSNRKQRSRCTTLRTQNIFAGPYLGICGLRNNSVIETAPFVRSYHSCRDPKIHQDIGCQACIVYNCCKAAHASSENFAYPIQYPRSRPVPSFIAACPSQSLETRFCLVVCPPPPFPLVSRFLCLYSH